MGEPGRNGREREIVRVDDLSVGYGGRPLLEKVTFGVRREEIFAILGRSGCGKTTLLRTIIGLLTPLAGTITILGRRLGADPESDIPARLHRMFGVLFQGGALISGRSLSDNVAMVIEEYSDLPPDIVAEMVRLKLEMVGLGGSGGKGPADLSGGMQKRAGLARAIALDPPILFCDEPTSGLDPATATEIDRLLLELRKLLGITMVIITHELASIRNFADRCLMLDRDAGGVIAMGTPAELEQENDDPRVQSFFRRRIDRKQEGLVR